jgi:type IV pilus assembly protein PilV
MSLIEVMVTAIVMAIGLLGIAALQLSTTKMTTESLSRSQAVMLVEFMADRIRTNLGGVGTYKGLVCNESGCNTGAVTDDCTNACTPENLAKKDADQWRSELAGASSYLTSVTGTVTEDANNLWTIRVYWDDSGIYGQDALNRDSSSLTDCAPQSATNKSSLQCYQIKLFP